jgi:hypothetical protein
MKQEPSNPAGLQRICLMLPPSLLAEVKREAERLPVPNTSAVVRAALVNYLALPRTRKSL